jgi:2,4-dienoyl-CoA reductase-like NADH-dependent reductase (Old Yellow Enzyme family)
MLRALLDDAAAASPGVAARQTSGGAEWSIGSTVFAALDGDTAEFRLDPVLAEAALRTPDTARSSRGRDWVAFVPTALEQTAIDRAVAWFAAAARRATPTG